MKPAVRPFTVTVTRNSQEHHIALRGTHDHIDRLCQRIDRGEGHWGEWFGPLTYRADRDPDPRPAMERQRAEYARRFFAADLSRGNPQ